MIGAAFAMTVLAVVLALVLSANLLTYLGLPYVAEGGSLAAKLHPAGLASALAAAVQVGVAGPLRIANNRCPAPPPLLLTFLTATLICLLFEASMTGAGNLIVLLDTYLPAGMLALALSYATNAQRRQLRLALQLGIAGNVLLVLGEELAHASLVPDYQAAFGEPSAAADFRPGALYDHPLTGAAITAIGVFIPPARDAHRRLHDAYLLLMALGLISFGGRAAMAATGVCLLCAAGWRLGRNLIRRRIGRRCLAPLLAVSAVLAAAAIAIYAGGFGERLGSHLYWDASAQVRLDQWQVLGFLDGQQLIFGIARPDLLALLEPMWLSYGVPVIENFWLLMFLSLGILGFPFFLLGFASLLIWCGRQGSGRALPMVLTLLATASASNSLGRKSTLLLVLVAAASSLPHTPREQGAAS